MKVGATATALALLVLAMCLMPAPIHAASLSFNPPQGIVGKQVSIASLCGYGSASYQLYWNEGGQLISQGETKQGCVSISFVVPEAARGKHKVTLKVGGEIINGEFVVIPSISISTNQDTVGSKLTVTGRGFNSNESDIQITYDGNPAETGIIANDKGSWQSTFKVPASNRGKHTIDAQGATPATEVEDKVFTVTPKIEISPTSGWVGTVVGISGSGFPSGETDIKVTYDGMIVKTAIPADTKGSWQSSFSVPSSAKGSHEIKVYGATTAERDVAATSFTVSPGIRVELVSGYLGGAIHVGDSLLVSGVGFEANETGIQVTCDGTLVISNLVTDAKGSWSDRLEVPPVTTGEHIIDASGQITKASDIVDYIIIVSPKIEMNPTSGAIDTEITVRGTGFTGDNVITISYDGTRVATGTATDTKGNFTASFKIPKCKAGDHTVTVTDAKASVFSSNLSVESTPPPTPRLISPEAGTEFNSIGKTTVTFDWSDVEDPSGVYYVLEISPSANFAGTVIRKEGLTASGYTLTEDEALAKGNYYWRVKAEDGAENQSDWTSGQLFKVGGMDWWLLLLIALVAIVVIIIIWRFVSVSRRDEWK
jgi:hypothetical protein